MTDKKGAEAMPEHNGETSIWPRLATIIAGLGTVGVYVTTNWTQIEPILSSSAFVLFIIFLSFGFGGLSIYWLVGRPLEKRLEKAEALLTRMRERERQLETQIGDLRVEVAELRTILKMSGLVKIGDLGQESEAAPDPT